MADTPICRTACGSMQQMRRDDDDLHLGELTGLLQALEKIPAVDVRHGQVEENDVGIVDVQRALAFGTIARQQNLKPVLPQRRREHAAHRQVVVDDEHALAIDVGDAAWSGCAVETEPRS